MPSSPISFSSWGSAGLVVVAVDRAGDMRLLVGRGAAAVDRGADVEHEQVGVVQVLLEPVGRNQRCHAIRPRRAGKGECQKRNQAEQTDCKSNDAHRAGLKIERTLEIEYFSL